MTLANTLSSISTRSHAIASGGAPAPVEPSPEDIRRQEISDAVQSDVIAGIETRSSGVLVDFAGRGSRPEKLKRSDLQRVLSDGGFPVDWAPDVKSDVAHAGQAVATLTASRDWSSKRSPAAPWNEDRTERPYRAHWIVTRTSDGLVRRVGQEAGTVVVTATLLDGSSTLNVESVDSPEARTLASEIEHHYQTGVAEQELTNSEVTTWLRELFVRRFGAAHCGRTSFVPAEHADSVKLLVGLVKPIFGSSWLVIPVTDSAGLARGIAENYLDEISRLARGWYDVKEKAAVKGKSPQDATVRTLLTKLSDLNSRAEVYRPLCTDGELDDTIQTMRTLIGECQEILGSVTVRFSLLDLSDEAPEEETDRSAAMGIAGRLADEALAKRQACKLPADWMPPGLTPKIVAADLSPMIHPDRIHPRPEYSADWV